MHTNKTLATSRLCVFARRSVIRVNSCPFVACISQLKPDFQNIYLDNAAFVTILPRLHQANIQCPPPRKNLFHTLRLAPLAAISAVIILSVARAEGVSFTVAPFSEERKPVAIDGPQSIALTLEPILGYKIVDSSISTSADKILWKPAGAHSYKASNIFSSQEFVHVDGTIIKIETGSGDGGETEPDPFHVTITAVDLDWDTNGSKGVAITEETEDEDFVWITDQTNGSFTVNAPLEGGDDMYIWEGKKIFDKYPDMQLTWDASQLDIIANGKLIEGGSLFIPRTTWGASSNPQATTFKVSRNINSSQDNSLLSIRLDRLGNAKNKNGGKDSMFNNNAAGTNVGGVNAAASSADNSHDVIKAKTLRVMLKEVSFSGEKYHEVARDEDGSKKFSAPHWVDNSNPLDSDANDVDDKKYPVCFTRNTKMKVSVKWSAPGVGPADKVRVSGIGPKGLIFPEINATVSAGMIVVENYWCETPFANTVDFFDPMEIKWTVKIGDKTFNGGTSSNQAYVTLGDPQTTVFHTLAHRGCEKAKDQSTVDGTTEKVWSVFGGEKVNNVERVDKAPLKYYASYSCKNRNTAELLKFGDGQCSAWALLFIDMLKVQGINYSDELATFVPSKSSQAAGFLISTWTFKGEGTSGLSTFPYENITMTSDYPGTDKYKWIKEDVKDDDGIKGQNNENPASIFIQHYAVAIGGKFYDPSYGVTYKNLQGFKENLAGLFLEGYGRTDDGNGGFLSTRSFFIRNRIEISDISVSYRNQ